jgi:hypothetical protein
MSIRLPIVLGILALASCAGPRPPLEVKTFKVLDVKIDSSADPMVRGEKQRRLYGAVSLLEQRERLGNYYTVLWQDPAAPGEVEVLFEYQQGGTASRILRQVRRFPATAASGEAEFAIIGSNYLEHGRVLAWQITLSRGGRVIASERSYLWPKTPIEKW